jgi:hypothetical protein
MKKNEVKIGTTYRVKVTGKIAEVRITGENPRGGWDGINVVTNRHVRIKSAQRLRGLVSRPAKRKKIVSLAEYESEATDEAKVETKRDAGKRGANVANTGDNPPRCKSILAAAVCVLKACDRPMGCKEIVAKAMETDIWQPRNGGKTPANTLSSAILRETKNKGEEARFVKAERGKFELAK